jgi:hypothetical protein
MKQHTAVSSGILGAIYNGNELFGHNCHVQQGTFHKIWHHVVAVPIFGGHFCWLIRQRVWLRITTSRRWKEAKGSASPDDRMV